MSNLVDLNITKNAVYYRIVYKWGSQLEYKVDKVESSYEEAMKSLKDIKEMMEKSQLMFKFINMEKITIKTENLKNLVEKSL